jgi:hypothetical protein
MESTQNIATSPPQDTSNASIQTDALLPQSSNREDIPYVLNAEQMTAK